MRLSVSFIAVSLASVVQANSGQFPVVDGVIGGIGNASASTLKAPNAAIVTTAGSTRVTENSGVCGTLALIYSANETDTRLRNNPECLHGLRVRRHC